MIQSIGKKIWPSAVHYVNLQREKPGEGTLTILSQPN